MAEHLAQESANHIGPPPADFTSRLVMDARYQGRFDYEYRCVVDWAQEISALAIVPLGGLCQVAEVLSSEIGTQLRTECLFSPTQRTFREPAANGG